MGPDVLGATVALTNGFQNRPLIAIPEVFCPVMQAEIVWAERKPTWVLLLALSGFGWLCFPSGGKTRKTVLSLQRLATLWWKISKRYDAFIRKCEISYFPQPTNTNLPPQGLRGAHTEISENPPPPTQRMVVPRRSLPFFHTRETNKLRSSQKKHWSGLASEASQNWCRAIFLGSGIVLNWTCVSVMAVDASISDSQIPVKEGKLNGVGNPRFAGRVVVTPLWKQWCW